MGHDDGNVAAQWSAGGGYAVRPLPFLSLGLEATYRAEGRDVRGFWQLNVADRRGVILQARVALGFGQRGRGARPSAAQSEAGALAPPTPIEIEAGTRDDGADDEAAELRALVVETALAAMGAPYSWGGSDANGFDCSGLIQYAYREQGLILPRVSRDQARTGMGVGLNVGALMPGDILGFSNGGAGVTHVGLYVGGGMFIHSASDGVRLTSLEAGDPDSRWWRERWVSARRVIN
jgi:cell wall-associated NlpC family hydrolase